MPGDASEPWHRTADLVGQVVEETAFGILASKALPADPAWQLIAPLVGGTADVSVRVLRQALVRSQPLPASVIWNGSRTSPVENVTLVVAPIPDPWMTPGAFVFAAGQRQVPNPLEPLALVCALPMIFPNTEIAEAWATAGNRVPVQLWPPGLNAETTRSAWQHLMWQQGLAQRDHCELLRWGHFDQDLWVPPAVCSTTQRGVFVLPCAPAYAVDLPTTSHGVHDYLVVQDVWSPTGHRTLPLADDGMRFALAGPVWTHRDRAVAIQHAAQQNTVTHQRSLLPEATVPIVPMSVFSTLLLAPHPASPSDLRLCREEPEALVSWRTVPGPRSEVQRSDLHAPKSLITDPLGVRLCLHPDATVSPLQGSFPPCWIAWRERRDSPHLDVLMTNDFSKPRLWAHPQQALAELSAAGAVAHIDPRLTIDAPVLARMGIIERPFQFSGPNPPL